MTGVQEIETTVGHDDRFIVLFRLTHHRSELVLADEAATALAALVQRGTNLRGRDGRHTELAYDKARREIGQRGRTRE